MPARFEIGRTPALPGPNCVELLIFLSSHRHRIGLLRINWFRQNFFRHRFELGGCFRFVEYLMKLLIYAEGLGRTPRIKVLLNFCHVVSSPDLGERANIARRTIKSWSRKKRTNNHHSLSESTEAR